MAQIEDATAWAEHHEAQAAEQLCLADGPAEAFSPRASQHWHQVRSRAECLTAADFHTRMAAHYRSRLQSAG